MRAGKLDRVVTIRRKGVGRNAFNEEVEDWHDLVSTRASMRTATTNERLASSQIGAEITNVFEIRRSATLATVTPKDRIECSGVEYDISGVEEIGRRGFRITATARAD
jgi:SPP1 family predicted phage head-tail adaptor